MYLATLLLGYFLLAIGIVALVAFPPVRYATGRRLAYCAAQSTRVLRRGMRLLRLFLTAPVQGVHAVTRHSVRFLWTHRAASTVVLLLVAIPPIIGIVTRGQHFFRLDQGAGPDARIQALLAGERLTAPQPLPPAVFTTREVELVRPKLVYASRDWDLLDEEFRQRLLLVYQLMHDEHGYDMVLLEGYRSPERQAELAKSGAQVTNARAYQSYHQYGLAADSAFFRDGKVVISEKDPWAMQGYKYYGELAEKVGLTWGGRWKLMDFGHVEYHRPGFKPGQPQSSE
jgi:peptidoglycan L-alanyl-D-glutamate endopeptidase CwlK